jgi:hypothetical protein
MDALALVATMDDAAPRCARIYPDGRIVSVPAVVVPLADIERAWDRIEDAQWVVESFREGVREVRREIFGARYRWGEATG